MGHLWLVLIQEGGLRVITLLPLLNLQSTMLALTKNCSGCEWCSREPIGKLCISRIGLINANGDALTFQT